MGSYGNYVKWGLRLILLSHFVLQHKQHSQSHCIMKWHCKNYNVKIYKKLFVLPFECIEIHLIWQFCTNTFLQNVCNERVHHESIFQTVFYLILNHSGTLIICYIWTNLAWAGPQPLRSSPIPAWLVIFINRESMLLLQCSSARQFVY